MIRATTVNFDFVHRKVDAHLESHGEEALRLWNAYVNWSKRHPSEANLGTFLASCIEAGVEFEEKDPNHVKNRGKEGIFGYFEKNWADLAPSGLKVPYSVENGEKEPISEDLSENREIQVVLYYLERLNSFFGYPADTVLEDWDVDDLAALIGEIGA